jgi:hypothetical protein
MARCEWEKRRRSSKSTVKVMMEVGWLVQCRLG